MVYSDGSRKEGVTRAGSALFKVGELKEVATKGERLPAGRSILDGEIIGMCISLRLFNSYVQDKVPRGGAGNLLVLTDSTEAITFAVDGPKEGPTAYLRERLSRAIKGLEETGAEDWYRGRACT